jgi:hypothetical protein
MSEAIAWLIRLNDPYFVCWELFTSWLEKKDNAGLYRRLSLVDADLSSDLHGMQLFR